MKVFCTDCHAVYFDDVPLNGCENLLCNGETLVINDDNFRLLESIKSSCCHMIIKQHVNLIGSVYFIGLGMVFCSDEKAQAFYEKSKSVIGRFEHGNRVNVEMEEAHDDQFIVTVEFADGYDELLYLEDGEKILAVLKFREILLEILHRGSVDGSIPQVI